MTGLAALALVAVLAQGQAPPALADSAELALRRGDWTTAERTATALVRAYERDGRRWPARHRTAAARAYVVLGARDADALRHAVAAFDAATAADSADLEPRLRVGDLFLEKYNAPEARRSYESVLALAPKNAAALLGLARVLAFEGRPDALATARRSLAADPGFAPAHVFLARSHLEAEAYDSAQTAAARALAADSSAVSAWAVLGAVAWLRGDTTGFVRARAAAARYEPRPASFYVDLADAAARHRRYAAAVDFARDAVRLDARSARGLGALGTNELRIGAIDSGRAHLERAFALDPFHVWNKNTLDLLDVLRGFHSTRSGRFHILTPPDETALLTLYLAPLLDSAYEALAARYGYRPPPPVRLELYRRHADFSVRTVGLAGLGALGVSFGTVLAMDAPSARERGSFNWGSTAWHELAHTFTLGLSDHRVPRWLSEGLSVLEERRARPGWGADVSVDFLGALQSGRLRSVSTLNDGFVRPTYPQEVVFSYYQASLVCEMIEADWGAAALPALLVAFRNGWELPAAVRRALRVEPAELDRRFDAWMRSKFALPLRSVTAGPATGAVGGAFIDAVTLGRELLAQGRGDSARRVLERAQRLFPDYAGEDSPAWYLAQLDTAAGDLRAAVTQLARITTRNETAWRANELEARLRERLGDRPGAAAALERLIWISPYEESVHRQLAELAEQMGDHARSVRERRAVVAVHPADPLEARYQLARVLALSGDRVAARREILDVLEGAPGFEKAQLLLLELRQGRNP
jgi:tetratricopeptide (TPR) repeat protein